MSEKATLLTSIPPVSKSEPVKKTSLLTPLNSEPSGSGKLLKPLGESSKPQSILSEVNATKDDSSAQVKNLNVAPPEAIEPFEEVAPEMAEVPVETTPVVETVAVDPSAEVSADGGSGMITVVSIVLVLCLVGVAVFVFLRKPKGDGAAKAKSDSVDWDDRKKAKAASGSQAASGPDPIIEFLNKEDQDAKKAGTASAPIKAVEQVSAGPPPPPKSKANKPLPPKRASAPKKPNANPKPVAAPNAPAQIKAPAKPKKRF